MNDTRPLVFLSERYRMLTEEQQNYVDAILTRGMRDCARWATRARTRSKGKTTPWSGFAAEKSFIHAANSGAIRIARDMLRSVGTVDDIRDRMATAEVCGDCGGHGRTPCDCLPKQFDDVAELVGDPDCDFCRGDGDIMCQECFGSGAILRVETSGHEMELNIKSLPRLNPRISLSRRDLDNDE